MPPVMRPGEKAENAPAETLEARRALGDASLGLDLEPVSLGDRAGGLLSALQRTGTDDAYVRIREMVGSSLSFSSSLLRQVIAGQTAVDHTLRVLDLAMAHQMDRRHAWKVNGGRGPLSPSYRLLLVPDIVLFGATGYTGRLTARALQKRGAKFILAGRNSTKLESLAKETDATDVAVCSVGDVDGLTRALTGARVLVTCVGPFVELGSTAVEAALRAGVHYVDSTGEGQFVGRLIAEKDRLARAAGIAMAPAFGFDEVPADTTATLASEGLEKADVTLTYALPGTGTRGTVKSAFGIMLGEGPWIENGRVRTIRAGEEMRWAPMPPPLGPRSSVSFPFAEGHLGPLHLDLNSFRLFMTAKRGRRIGMRFALPALRAARATPLRGALDRMVERAPEGPSDTQRPKQRWTILAEARARNGWRNVALMGTDPYGLTGELLATAALEMCADGYDQKGVISPVQAVGIDKARKELESHGTTVQVWE